MEGFYSRWCGGIFLGVCVFGRFFSCLRMAAGGSKKRDKHQPAAKCLGLTAVVRLLLWEDVPLGLTYYFLGLQLAF